MTLLEDVEAAIATVDVRSATRASLARLPARLRVVAIGKAATPMVEGLFDVVGARSVLGGVVVVPDGARAPRRLEVMVAAHPVPDARSARAAERCLQIARDCAADGTPLVALVSGGASSLVCAPALGITLADKRAVTATMLRSGASITEVNRVRKRLSRIKGGWLAHAAGSAPVVTRIVSDVIGGGPEDVGSGPTIATVDSASAVRRLLRRYAPRLAALPLGRVPPVRAGDVRIVASPESVTLAVARALHAKRLPPSTAPVAELAAEYVALAAKRGVVVRAAEPSLVVPRRAGQGGRSTHLAALVARDLPRGATFLALATDGVDGASKTGGALVTGDATDDQRRALGLALQRFDTGSLLRSYGWALHERPTGRNFADVHVLVRT